MQTAVNKEAYHELLPQMLCRHGLITGATGSGKTVSIKVLAESFSELGIPVFLQDVKGDLSGFIEKGVASVKFKEHLERVGVGEPDYQTYPTVFWDVFGELGHPMRTTISEMGPLMMSRLLKLNDTQMGIVYTVFKVADDQKLLLLDLKDFVALLDYVSANRKELITDYGMITMQSVAAIKRKLLMYEQDGLACLFGEPALDMADLMKCDHGKKGTIHVLNAKELSHNPSTYSGFLLWMLSELYEQLEEVGELELPKMVFFFDEAHLIFNQAPPYLLEKIEQVIKLIRSKGVAIFFVTQSPADVPDEVLSQLGNRIQHVLRAYTPKEQKAVRVAADSFRANPKFDTATIITQLGVGEALISFLDKAGVPKPVERVWMMPPKSKIGSSDEASILSNMKNDRIGSKYDSAVDRESAFELLKNRIVQKETEALEMTRSNKHQSKTRKRRTDTPMDKMLKSAATAIGSQIGRTIIRGIMGSLSKR
ncbi:MULTISPECIES: helicase HerA-like domain-containing protein [unclassified Fusibacter]|uniref:helicase HerA-like domain-containing protein n=1 Tax=unclassified Fusibacter TaxID=2624464 RepID=UPI001010B1EC|nr:MULTISPECIES: helicase HerA-like domain-containing protein [unclassified Fusibacter]MCK8058645.1 DUF853 domain-containing protein [Fusibacter sp. A2]NPE21720.1 DUF853 family protein [Fusibacter sp. A1]RXV61294.1 DUF853 family protein [Fusibacter sp. A1]